MRITFDPPKRDATLAARGIDFRDAESLFQGPSFSFEEDRFDHGETRIVTVGLLDGRMVIVVWTHRGADRHVISMRRPMTESKRGTDRTSSLPGETDLARVDAHVVGPEEYDDIPELTDEMVARSVPGSDPARIRRGRPHSARRKELVSIRLDPDILDALRATGPGWQTRINEALREWLRRRAA